MMCTHEDCQALATWHVAWLDDAVCDAFTCTHHLLEAKAHPLYRASHCLGTPCDPYEPTWVCQLLFTEEQAAQRLAQP